MDGLLFVLDPPDNPVVSRLLFVGFPLGRPVKLAEASFRVPPVLIQNLQNYTRGCRENASN